MSSFFLLFINYNTTMKILYLIRHAKSSWEFDISDHERPLKKRGIKDASLIGDRLKSLIQPVDLVMSSSATRALRTAEIITEALDISYDAIEVNANLYDFDGRQVMEIIKNCPDRYDSLMIFGHNHALTLLANNLGNERIENVPTAGVVGISFEEDSWKKITSGKNLLTLFPKTLKE